MSLEFELYYSHADPRVHLKKKESDKDQTKVKSPRVSYVDKNAMV